ncbi:hypothetical protein TYRP_012079 [Tyrophagus putrescentiae]|nr:hypothetical protein TYRP_012079 [Tyrophagus putrescentiae]
MSGPAAHPDVTWPLSTPSSSGLARCARETLVVDLAALGSSLFPLQQRERLAKAPPPWAMLPSYSLCFLTALQPRPKTVAASGQSLSQHSCRDSDTRARGSQSQRRIATDSVPNFLSFLSIVSDLKSGKRGVFAIGNVGSQLTLFVSGSGSTHSPSGGYQVAVSESKGAFKITGTPVSVPSGIPSDAAVIFYCKDSGDNLVAMSSKSVGVLPLPSGSYEPTEIDSEAVGNCYKNGYLYLSTTESLNYFVISSTGYAVKYHFYANSDIKSLTSCSSQNPLGHLCINGDNISIKKKCDGSPLSGVISGFVSNTAYFVDGSGTVYSFPGSALVKDGSAKLTKLTKEKAFVGEAVQPTMAQLKSSNHSVGVIIGTCVGIVLLCVAFFAITCFVDPKYVKVRAAINKFKNKNKGSKESDHHKLDDRNSSNKKHSSKREGSSSSKSKSKSRKSHSSRRKSKNGTKSKHNTHKLPGKSILTSGKTTGKTSAGGSHGRRGHSAGQEAAGSRGGRSRSRSRTRRPSGGHSRGGRRNGSAQAQTGGHHQQHHRHQQNTTDHSPTTTTATTTPQHNQNAAGGSRGGGHSRTVRNHSPQAQVHAQQPMQTVVHTAAHTPSSHSGARSSAHCSTTANSSAGCSAGSARAATSCAGHCSGTGRTDYAN